MTSVQPPSSPLSPKGCQRGQQTECTVARRLGTIGTLLTASKLLNQKVDRRLAELREYLRDKKLPQGTRREVQHYMEHLYKMRTGYDVSEVLGDLPPRLQISLLNCMYREIIIRVPIFRGLQEEVTTSPPPTHACTRSPTASFENLTQSSDRRFLSTQVIAKICLKMKRIIAMQNDFVFVENTVGREMYVLERGEVELSRYDNYIGTLAKNSFFGFEALLPGRQRRPRSAKAVTNCELGFISKEDCQQLCRGDHHIHAPDQLGLCCLSRFENGPNQLRIVASTRQITPS